MLSKKYLLKKLTSQSNLYLGALNKNKKFIFYEEHFSEPIFPALFPINNNFICTVLQ